MGRRVHSWLALAAWLLLLVESGAHAARKGVVVLAFSGPQGGQAAQIVTRSLAGRYRIVSRGQFLAAAAQQGVNPNRPPGRAAAAAAVQAAAVVGGSVSRVAGRWVLTIFVYSGHDGERAGSATFPLRGARIDPATAQRIPGGLSRALASARVGPPVHVAGVERVRPPPRRRAARPARPVAVAVRTTPPPRTRGGGGFDDGTDVESTTPTTTDGRGGNGDSVETTAPDEPGRPAVQPRGGERTADAGDDLFEVPGGGERTEEPPEDAEQVPRYKQRRASEQTRVTKKSDERSPWEKIVELSVGVMVISRSFDFNDPVKPTDPQQHSNYRSGAVAAIALDGAVYPLSFFHRGPLANLGIVGRYYRVLGLKSQPAGTEPIRTTLHDMQIGLRYRWNILGSLSSPTLQAGIEYGRLGFIIWDEPSQNIGLPDVVYNYLKFALVGLEVPFYAKDKLAVGAMGSFDYLLIFDCGEIEVAEYPGYGNSSTGGIDLGLGLFGSYYGFFVKLNGFYRRIFFDFNNACGDPKLTCRAAGGALDIYLGGSILAGYAF